MKFRCNGLKQNVEKARNGAENIIKNKIIIIYRLISKYKNKTIIDETSHSSTESSKSTYFNDNHDGNHILNKCPN
jgi:hypothetical protein